MTLLRDGWHILEDALRRTVQPIYALDAAGTVVWFNAACERLTGRSAATVLGQTCPYRGSLDQEPAALESSLAAPPEAFTAAGPPPVRQTLIPLADGTARWCRIRFVPLAEDAGRVQCVLGLIGPAEEASDRGPAVDWSAALQRLRQRLRERYGLESLIGQCPAMQRVCEQVRLAGTHDRPVLLIGQRGTGRQRVARAIHAVGARAQGPFVALACSVLDPDLVDSQLWGLEAAEAAPAGAPVGLYEAARGGSLWIDELARLPRESQSRLAQALARPEADGPRILAATASDPAGLVADGTLRADLYHALSIVTITLPPLRERGGDLPLLAQWFVEQYNAAHAKQVSGLSPEALDLIGLYPWPGNVAELQTVIEAACDRAAGPQVQVQDLPPRVQGQTVAEDRTGPESSPDLALEDALLALEKKTIQLALERARGNKSRAAELLKISRPRLYRRMQMLGLVDPRGEPGREPA